MCQTVKVDGLLELSEWILVSDESAEYHRAMFEKLPVPGEENSMFLDRCSDYTFFASTGYGTCVKSCHAQEVRQPVNVDIYHK